MCTFQGKQRDKQAAAATAREHTFSSSTNLPLIAISLVISSVLSLASAAMFPSTPFSKNGWLQHLRSCMHMFINDTFSLLFVVRYCVFLSKTAWMNEQQSDQHSHIHTRTQTHTL